MDMGKWNVGLKREFGKWERKARSEKRKVRSGNDEWEVDMRSGR